MVRLVVDSLCSGSMGSWVWWGMDFKVMGTQPTDRPGGKDGGAVIIVLRFLIGDCEVRVGRTGVAHAKYTI